MSSETIVENRNLTNTYVANGSILGTINPDIVVRQYPLVKGEFVLLSNSDEIGKWQDYFLVALITAVINVVCKLVSFHYVFSESENKPAAWELILVGLSLFGLIVAMLINKCTNSERKRLKDRITKQLDS